MPVGSITLIVIVSGSASAGGNVMALEPANQHGKIQTVDVRENVNSLMDYGLWSGTLPALSYPLKLNRGLKYFPFKLQLNGWR